MNWKSDFPCESQRLSWVPYVPSLEFQRLSSFPDGRISQIWIQSETRKPKCQSKNLPITWQQVKVDLFPKNLTILSLLCATPLSVLPGASCAVSIWCEPGGRGFHEFWGGNQISKNRAHPKGLLFFSSLDSKWLGFLGHFLASFPDKKGWSIEGWILFLRFLCSWKVFGENFFSIDSWWIWKPCHRCSKRQAAHQTRQPAVSCLWRPWEGFKRRGYLNVPGS